MMTSPSLSVLNTSGGFACSGRNLKAREIRSRTSFDAASISRSSSKAIEIDDLPGRERDVTFLIPAMPEILSSSIRVILDSTIAAEAPG